MSVYRAQFPVGSRVQILAREPLEQFMQTWKYHHPISITQLPFAGHQTTVRDVSFYHGGDPLYELEGVPGYWHEPCIRLADANGAA